MKAFTEDEWSEEKRARPRHMRAPAEGQLDTLDARPRPRKRTPPRSVVVAPLEVEPEQPANPAGFGLVRQVRVQSPGPRATDTERRAMYATTYGDDFRQ